MEKSIHDNFLVSYEVLSEQRTILLRTEFHDNGEPFELTDVVFTGVCAYRFWHDSFDNVIFDIEETVPEAIYNANRVEIEAGWKYGWPGVWGETEEAALAYFREHGIHGFKLQSSCGLEGWILAKAMEKISRDKRVA